MPRLPSALATSALACFTLTACPAKAPPGDAQTAQPVRVPPGCERNQAGEYHHAGNPSFRYLAEDDGRTLTLTVLHARADGGVEATPDAGTTTVTLVLTRTPEGFLGETRATGFTVSGAPCPVTFPTEITACTDEALTLRSVASTAIDEACRPPPSGPPPARLEQVLRRGAPAPRP